MKMQADLCHAVPPGGGVPSSRKHRNLVELTGENRRNSAIRILDRKSQVAPLPFHMPVQSRFSHFPLKLSGLPHDYAVAGMLVIVGVVNY
jgi:hypothetical protein